VAVVAARQGVERVSFQERVERSRAGRVAISLFAVLTVLTILTANLPASHLENLLMKADHPYLNAVDMQQNWGVFAPDPRSQTVDLLARVTFADGSQETWQIPTRDAVVGEYVDYRWRKWEEWIVSPSYAFLYKPGAIYVARRLATPTRRPVRVTLFNRSHPIIPPGQPVPPAPAAPTQFYSTKITPAMLSGASG
jgi:hypothetical protein